MNILLSIECLRVGGAQTFVLRLAQALAKDHQVYIYYHYWDYIARDMVEKLAPHVPLATSRPFGDYFIRKLDRLLYKLQIDFSFREKIVARDLRKFVRRNKIDVVHSNMFKSDYVVSKSLKGIGIPVVVTMHGSYESLLFHFEGKVPGEVILNFPQKLQTTLANIQGLVYLADKNLITVEYLKAKGISLSLQIRQIYNGFEGKFSVNKNENLLSKTGIRPDSLVFGMVARGVPAKGWQEAIDAFLLFKKRYDLNADLVLIGHSKYTEILKEKFQDQSNIHFIGHLDNPIDWIKDFKVGLLPSYTESLPNAIIEYLFCGKAVIATDVGAVKQMIQYKEESAGFVLDLDKSGKPNVEQLASYMGCYAKNPDLQLVQGAIALKAYKKFEMSYCLQNYQEMYQYLIKNTVA